MPTARHARNRLWTAALTLLLGVGAFGTTSGPVAANSNCASPSNLGDSGTGLWVGGGTATKMCLHRDSGGNYLFYVQHISLKEGARLRIVSEGVGNWQFLKRTASNWFYWMPSSLVPAGTTLYSTTNASYFMDTDESHTTGFSFLHKKGYSIVDYGQVAGSDTNPKVSFGVPAEFSPAYVNIKFFPSTGDPTLMANAVVNSKDAVASYCADCGPNAFESVRRTMLAAKDTDGNGTNDQLWIFTSFQSYTARQVYDYLRLNPAYLATSYIQMDGGNSTQMYSTGGVNRVDSGLCFPVGCRSVPNVVAVFSPN